MLTPWGDIDATVLVALITAIGAILATKQKRQQDLAEKQETRRQVMLTEQREMQREATERNNKLIDNLQEESHRLASDLKDARSDIGGVYRELSRLRGYLAEYERGTAKLSTQIRGYGHEPVWFFPITETPER